MAEGDADSRESDAPAVPPWRRWFGISLFALHLVLPVIGLIEVPIFGLPESMNAILLGLSVVGGPDVLPVVSIAMLGRDGVTELMTRFGSIVKRITKWDAARKQRSTVGLWVLVISLLAPTVILFFWHDSIASIGGAPGWAFWVLLGSTFAFIGAVISMGAPLWAGMESYAESRFPSVESLRMVSAMRSARVAGRLAE